MRRGYRIEGGLGGLRITILGTIGRNQGWKFTAKGDVNVSALMHCSAKQHHGGREEAIQNGMIIGLYQRQGDAGLNRHISRALALEKFHVYTR